MVILTKSILILEDDLAVLSKLLKSLSVLEGEQPYSLSVIVITNYRQVEELINKNSDFYFDIILLDRDCKLGGSFHVFDIEKFGADKVVSISSVPEYNEDAKKRGVKKVILKDLSKPDEFVEAVVKEVEERLQSMSLVNSLKNNSI